MKKLELSPTFSIPADAVTQTFGVLAVRGAGKSNAAAVMAEEMFAAGLPFVAIDPVGSWHGLRAAGTAPGLSIPIFGGHHGDVPLERGGAELVADTIVEERLSCVLDVSAFESESAKRQFLTAFAERLFRQKGKPGNDAPLHLFLEEADDYAPQMARGPEMARCLGAFQRIVKQGRARGLGATMITQRSAALNKDLLTQLETLIVLRTTSPQDRKAIAGWVEYHGQAQELLESLSRLEAGEAWIWSPQWLGLVERVRFRRRRTFDSGATPGGDRAHRRVGTLADVDLGALKTRMAATIEKAKAEDPRELRKTIADLQRELAAARAVTPAPATVERVEVPVLKDEHARRLEAAVGRLEKEAAALGTEAREIRTALMTVRNASPRAMAQRADGGGGPVVAAARANATIPRPAPVVSRGDGALGGGERRVLAAIAQHPSGVTREHLTVLTGYKRSSRDTYLQRLRAGALVAFGAEGIIKATAAGVEVLGSDYEPLPTGTELRKYWLARLPEGEGKILSVLVAAYPRAIARDELDDQVGYKRSSRDTYLQRLTSRQLVQAVGRGEVRASEDLFS